MLKRILFSLMTLAAIAVMAAYLFVQTSRFAKLVKGIVAQNLPADLGIEGDFSEFRVKVLPPGLSIRNPKVTLAAKNILNWPEGSAVQAERIDLTLSIFQMITGRIRIREVTIVKGDIRVNIDPATFKGKSKKKTAGLGFHWDELLQIHAESIALEETQIHLHWMSPDFSTDLFAKRLRVGQWAGRGGMGYQLEMDIRDVAGNFPKEWKAPDTLEAVNARIRVNALGIQIDDVSVRRKSVGAVLSGVVLGNILSPKDLIAEAKLDFKGELTEILEGLKIKEAASGRLSFSGKIHGNLQQPYNTFKSEGSLAVDGLKFRDWEADKVQVDGAWVPSSDGGEISVAKATIQSKEVPREGGMPGRGGKVEVGPFKYQIGSPSPITAHVSLERAHIHWFAAPVVKKIYALGFRVSGNTEITVTPPATGQKWSLQTQLDLAVNDFQLDNQDLGKPGVPLMKVLQIPKILVAGGVNIDSSGLRPNGLFLTLPHGKFQASGKLDFETGFDLYANGAAKLEEVGKIAEQSIRGDANVNCHIHGLPKRVLVDFDFDIKNAFYVHLALGDLHGRITLDEDPRDLFFKNIVAHKGNTTYQGGGLIQLAAKTIALDIQILQGETEDLIPIFDDLTQELTWLPRSMTGQLKGTVKISGELDTSKLEVAAIVDGHDWEYYRERFHSLTFKGGYDKGKFYLEDLNATKSSGILSGGLSFAMKSKIIGWNFHTEQFTLSDLDHVATLDVPMRGRLTVQSLGHGPLGEIESTTEMSLTDVMVRGIPLPPSDFRVRTNRGVVTANANFLGGQGVLNAAYDFHLGGESYIRGELRHFDFTPALLLLNPKSIQDTALTGYLSGGIDVKFKSGQIERFTGKLEVSEYVLAKSDVKFRLSHPILVQANQGSFEINDLSLSGDQGEATLALASDEGSLDGSISGTLDVGIVEFFFPVITRASGLAELDFGIGGEIKAPEISGHAKVGGAVARTTAIESSLENITGSIQLKQNIVTVKGMEADLANGRVTGDGTIRIFTDRYPAISLDSTISGSKIKVFPFQYVKVNGKVRIFGESSPYTIDGLVNVDSALSREGIYGHSLGRSLKAAKYTPPSKSRSEGGSSLFRLNLDVVAENGVLVKNDFFDIELKAKLKLVNTLEVPRMLGTVDLVQGKVSFKDRKFQIQSASAVFDSPTVINPSFNLTALTEISSTKIQLYSSGRLDDFKIEFSSNPVMPEQEILSLLAIGATSDDVRNLKQGDRSAVQQGDAASLLLHSTGFNQDIQSKTGIQVEVDQAVNNQAGRSIFRPGTDAEVTSAPKIVLKRQISKEVELSVGSTVGVGQGSEQDVNLEYRVTPGFSLLGVWSSYDDITIPNSTQQSYGVDLKLQRRFKW